MKKYRFLSGLLLLAVLCSLPVPVCAQEEPSLFCTHAILLDANYGEILYDKGASQRAYPASTTKLTTCLLVLEAIQSGQLTLQTPVTAGDTAYQGLSGNFSPADIKVGETLTVEESLILLDKVQNPRARTFLLTALHTGMRRGEILGLQWKDIDFKAKVIHVRHNAVVSEGESTVSEELKTKAAKRNLPLSEELEVWLLQRKKTSHSQYVIAMENHKPLTKSSYRSLWRLIERELPEKHITAHILRHTYITRLFEAGLDVKEVQYLAGHSTMDDFVRT